MDIEEDAFKASSIMEVFDLLRTLLLNEFTGDFKLNASFPKEVSSFSIKNKLFKRSNSLSCTDYVVCKVRTSYTDVLYTIENDLGVVEIDHSQINLFTHVVKYINYLHNNRMSKENRYVLVTMSNFANASDETTNMKIDLVFNEESRFPDLVFSTEKALVYQTETSCNKCELAQEGGCRIIITE